MKRRLRRVSSVISVIVALLAFSPGAIRAQIPTPDTPIDDKQARAGTRWRALRSPNFQVVFPVGLDADAQRVAATLELLRVPLGKTMGAPPRPITLVLYNQSTEANGGVGLFPRHSEWVTTPPAFGSLLGPYDWLSILAIHETRHVAQFDQTRVGFTSFLYKLWGETGLALAQLEIPGWLWEGDAVGTETSLSTAGRGRQPAFDKEIRALALDGKLPGYYQAMLGSYARFFPNLYPLGYTLTTHLRRTQSPDVIDRIFRRSAARSWNPFSFHFAVKHETHLSPPRVYDGAMRELTALWRQQQEGLPLTNAERRSPAPSIYTNYDDPHFLADGTLIALRHGFADVRQVVRIEGERVTPLADAPGDGIRAGGMLVAWTDMVRDPRWGRSDHTRIRLLDAATGKVRTLSGRGRRGRWAGVAPSPDGRRVAAVETRELGGESVVVLDATSGAPLRSIEVPDREHAMEVAWRADGAALVFTRQGVRGKALTLLDLASGTLTDLLPRGETDVSHPVFAGDYVLYVSPYSGIDNVYAVHTLSGARYQVTSRRVGAYMPSVSPDARRLLFSDYTSDGFGVMEMPLDAAAWKPIDSVAARPVRYYEPLVAQEQFTLHPAEIADSARYPVRSYRSVRHALHVHSWSPLLGEGGIGAEVSSTDYLNTLESNLALSYNENEHTGSVSAGASYGGFYPILETQVTLGGRSSSYEAAGDSVSTLYGWREQSVEAGVRLPLDFSRGIWFRSVSLGAHVGVAQVSGLARAAVHPPGNGRFAPVTYGLQAVNVRGGARRDLAPRWGQRVFAQYRYTPLRGDFHPRRFEAFAVEYLPAPVRHHGLRVSGHLEDNLPDGPFGFSTNITAPRGYDLVFARRMVKVTADYALPIAYPDVALGPLLYIPRLTAGAFYDWFRSSGSPGAGEMSSVGVELLADVMPLSLPVQISAGARLVRRLSDGKVLLEPAVRLGL